MNNNFLFYSINTDILADGPAVIRELTSFATEFGLEGNIWQQWLAYMIMTDENAFSLACERREVRSDSTLMQLAASDLAGFYRWMNMQLSEVISAASASGGGSQLPGIVYCAGSRPGTDTAGRVNDLLQLLTDYHSPYEGDSITGPGKRIRDFRNRLAAAENEEGFRAAVAYEYEMYGTGIYGLYRAFRIAADRSGIVPVMETTDVTFDDLIGYESQKQTLRANTEAFVSGEHANNVLLYGDSGTGKSTSIHALMHDYFDRGLRLVEIGKQHRDMLPHVLSEIKKRNYRFIIFLDDLSFEENESDYKELKAMLEGALEAREDRVLIYATSNRRHLIRETWRDRNDMEYQEDVHRSDTMEEKLSLASRFGVMIYYPKPDPAEYLNIVRELAELKDIELKGKDLEEAARKWELRHGGMSGRTAAQLITWLEGQKGKL